MHALSDAFLYELNDRGSILDQHHSGFVRFCLCANGPLHFGVIHTSPKHVEQIDTRPFDSPSRADTKVAELGGLVGGVPALHNQVEALGQSVRPIAS
jgi:hypothetical protein